MWKGSEEGKRKKERGKTSTNFLNKHSYANFVCKFYLGLYPQ